jgi:hypothetical protein
MENKIINSTRKICDNIKEEIIDDEKECFSLYRHCKKKIIKFIKYIKSKF